MTKCHAEKWVYTWPGYDGDYRIMYIHCNVIVRLQFTLLSHLFRSNGLFNPCQDAVMLLDAVLFILPRVEFPHDD